MIVRAPQPREPTPITLAARQLFGLQAAYADTASQSSRQALRATTPPIRSQTTPPGCRRTCWPIAEAPPDPIRLLDYFAHRYGRPLSTIAAGESLGGLISEGLAQRHPTRISGALSLCGVSGGAVGFWNQALDAAL